MIIEFSNKPAKNQPLAFNNEIKRIASAYWQTLENIFHLITKNIINLQPKDIKTNRFNIKNAQKQLEKLLEFFKQKKKRETRLSNELYIHRMEKR